MNIDEILTVGFSLEIKWAKPPDFDGRLSAIKQLAETVSFTPYDNLIIHILTIEASKARIEFSIKDLDDELDI